MTHEQRIQQFINQEKLFRDEQEEDWELPPVKDCLLFILTELVECLEAYALNTNPRYLRTNAKETNYKAEMIQACMMVASASISLERDNTSKHLIDSTGVTIQCLVLLLCDVLFCYQSVTLTQEKLKELLSDCLYLIDHFNLDASKGLQAEHEKIRLKIQHRIENKNLGA